jgi:hypothetical protein
MDSFKYSNSYIVQCEDCGLKYKIKSSDSILDYECDSCGGSLRYMDDEMNKELDKYLEERRDEIESYKKSKANEPTSEELNPNEEERSLKSLTNKLGNFFSEEHMLQIADDERTEQEMEEEGRDMSQYNRNIRKTEYYDGYYQEFKKIFLDE